MSSKLSQKKLNQISLKNILHEDKNFALFMSLVLTILAFGVFFSQFSISDIITFGKTGDQTQENYPMFIQLGNMIKNRTLMGIDCGVYNGGAELFYKIYTGKYLIYFIMAGIGAYTNFELAYVSFFAIHMFILLYFGQRLANRFLGINRYKALLVVCSTSSVFFLNSWFPVFAAITALVYPMLYFSLLGLEGTKKRYYFLLSLPYVLTFTCGAVIYDCTLALLTIVISLLYWYCYKKDNISLKKAFFRVCLPGFIGGIIAFPYLLQFYLYTKNDSVAPNIINMATALDLKLKMTDIIGFIIQSYNKTTGIEGMNFFNIGIIWAIAIFIFIKLRAYSKMAIGDKRFCFSLIGINFILFLISLGILTPFAVWFFSYVPIFGSEHLPWRFAMITIPLLFLALVKCLELLENTTFKYIKYVVYLLGLLILFSILLNNIVSKEFNVEKLVLELLLAIIVLYQIYEKGWNNNKVIVLWCVVLLLFSYREFYQFQSVNSFKFNLESTSIAYDTYAQDTVDDFIAELQEKQLYRYVEMDSVESVPYYWPCNYAWYHNQRHPVSNYMGYPLHEYISKSYRMETAKITYFKGIDWTYLLDTRADFIAADQSTIDNNKDVYNLIIDWSKPTKTVHGYIVLYPLKKFIPSFYYKTDVLNEYVLDAENSLDNGYFYSANLTNDDIVDFKSDGYSDFEMTVNAKTAAFIEFLPYSGKYLKYYLDDKQIEPVIYKGQAYIASEAGVHSLKVKYVNNFEKNVFKVFGVYYELYLVYALVVLLIFLFNKKKKRY